MLVSCTGVVVGCSVAVCTHIRASIIVQILLFLARSSFSSAPVLVAVVADSRDETKASDSISVQSNGTIYAGPDNSTALYSIDVEGALQI